MAEETVTVGCKLPNGLIIEVGYDPLTGQKGETYASHRLNGSNQHKKLGDKHTGEGFGLTFDVPKSLWERWHDAHKKSSYITNGLIFAHAQKASVEKQQREVEDEKTGLEPGNMADYSKKIKKIEQYS